MSVHVDKKPLPEAPQRPSTLSWVVAWAAMVIGIAASLAANVAHATPTVTGRTIAGWAPVALLLVVEVLAHTPRPRFWVLAWTRDLGTAIVAGVAATASYRHMRDLALQAGEDRLTASTLPLSADGLILVASVSLMSLAYERRAAIAAEVAARMPLPVPLPPAAPQPDPMPLPDPMPTVPPDADPLPVPLPPLPEPMPLRWQPDAPLPDVLAAGLNRFPDETRTLFERAYRLVLAADAAGRPLTGAQLGALCERGERWGRDRLREVRTAVRDRPLSGVS